MIIAYNYDYRQPRTYSEKRRKIVHLCHKKTLKLNLISQLKPQDLLNNFMMHLKHTPRKSNARYSSDQKKIPDQLKKTIIIIH